jgi:hypothetical protein
MANELTKGMVTAFGAIQAGQAQQVLIERTLGQALLAKMGGHALELVKVYQALGGNDPVVLTMLGGKLGEAFKALPLEPGVEAGRAEALSAGVHAAAGKKSVQLDKNVLTGVEGQALHTLANLGGSEFAKKYNLERG